MSEHPSYYERELLSRVAQGDERAFGELVMTHKLRLEAFVLQVTRSPELTDEIVQDAFLQVWQTREGLTEVRKFSDFLFILCRNQTFNAIRNRVREEKRRQQWKSDYEPELVFMPDPDNGLLEDIVNRAVSELPPQQQRTWQLSRREGKKHHEIAAEMNLSKETVKKHIQLANAFIIRHLQEHKELWTMALWLYWPYKNK